MKSFFVLAALSPLAVLAGPPACIGHVVGMQGMPSDLDTLCFKNQQEILSDLVKKCASNELKPAHEQYAEVCKGVNVDVGPLPAASSASSSAPVPTPTESKPASAAAAIAPHAVIFTIFGLSTTGLFSMMFL